MKKKVVDDAPAEEDCDYEILPYETYGPLQTSQLPCGDPTSVKDALYVNQIPFCKMLLPKSPENPPSTSSRIDPYESRSSDPNAYDISTRKKSTETMRGIATNPEAMRRLSSSDPRGLSDPDDALHSYLVVEYTDPRKRKTSTVSNISTDSIYVISKLETGIANSDDETFTSLKVSQSAVVVPAVELESQLESTSASASNPLLAAAPYEHNVTSKNLHCKQPQDDERFDHIWRRKCQVESQYANIKVEGGHEDTKHSIRYTSEKDRRNYLSDLVKGFRNLEHPTSPASATDAYEERQKYLMNLSDDIRNRQGGYCTFGQNFGEATLDNESAYMNIQCLKSDAEGEAAANENGSTL